MRGRKSQVSSTLVIMIAGMIGLLVLIIVTGGFAKVFKTITGKSDCQMQFLISSFTKTGGAQTIEPECEPHLITVTQDTLDKGASNAKKVLTEYQKNFDSGKYKGIDSAQQYWNGNFQGYSDPNTKKLNEWVMDKTVADEMKYCWDVTGRGNLDLFNDWWTLLDCRIDGCTNVDDSKCFQKCTKEQIYGMYGLNSDGQALTALGAAGIIWELTGIKGKTMVATVTGLPLLYKTATGQMQIAQPPTFCVLCSRIKFDETAKTSIKNPSVTSMSLWLANNPVTDVGDYSKVSYASYLQNDAYKGLWASKDSYSYDTNQAYAVLYTRINVMKSKQLLGDIGTLVAGTNPNDLPQAVQMIKLVPYQNIKNECTYLVG